MKKKVLSVLMVFMMCLGLAGCGGGSNSTSDDISGKVSLNGSTSMESLMPYQKELKKNIQTYN